MDSKIDKSVGVFAFFRWTPAAVLRISGEDSFQFLQGQFSNDLRELASGTAVYGLWLNHKGRVLADSFVIGGQAGEHWVVSYSSPGAVIRERLEAFIIADDVVVEDLTGAWSGVAVMGGRGPAPGRPAAISGVAFAGRRALRPVEEWVYPSTQENEYAVAAALAGGEALTAAAMEELRIAAGLPAVPQDIGPGELPNEGGLDVSAVSYTKGCYLGQEVMARLKNMGQVRRRLVRVAGSGGFPALPAALFDGDRRVGELRSAAAGAAGFEGLALLTLLQLRPDVHLGFAAGGADNPVRLVDAP